MATLVAGYGFSETSGSTVLDVTGLHPGTLNGATRTASGKYGSALAFDGVNDRVDVADAPALDLTTALTVMAWVYPTTVSGWRTVVLKEQPGQLVYALYSSTNTGRPSGHVYIGGDRQLDGPAALPVNTWSHLAMTYDGSAQRLYVNGVQVAQRSQTGACVVSTGALRFGGNALWPEWFSGRLDEVRIYTGALTASEVQAAMAVPVDPVTPPAPPPIPANCRAILSGGVILDWVWQGTGSPSGFAVELQPTGGAWTSLGTSPAAARTRVVDGLTLGAWYGYRVTPIGATLSVPAPIVRAMLQSNGMLVKE